MGSVPAENCMLSFPKSSDAGIVNIDHRAGLSAQEVLNQV